eukprot:6720813-Lingulodinium_polyedra.AAC.2
MGSGADRMGSPASAARGGRPRCTAAVRHGSHTMSFTVSAVHAASGVRRFTALERKTPPLLPMMCSSVSASRPSHAP